MIKRNLYKILLLVILLTGTEAYAQPANNTCSGAITSPQNGSCLNGTTASATDTWTGSVGCQSGGNNVEVWYTFVATGTQAQIVVTNGTMGGDIEITLVSATGACSGLGLEGATCGASPLTGTYNNLQVGTTYYYTISSTGSTGTFTTCVTSSTPAPTPGQDCTNAASLCTGTGFSQGTFTGVGTAENIATNSCFGGNERQAKWYTFTVGAGGTFEFLVDPNTNSNDYDWAIWNTTSGCYSSGTTMGAPTQCNWSGCPGNTGIVADATVACATSNYWSCAGSPGACGAGDIAQFNYPPPTLTAGQTYTMLIDNYSSSSGGFSASFGGTAVMGPRANFTTSLSADCMTLTVNRGVYYTGTNMTYSWSFGDGSTSTAGVPGAHTYSTMGVYTVSLTVTDATGCTDVFSQPVNVGCILPIELISFDGVLQNKQVKLKWITASETGNDYFTIERSIDGINYEEIGTVKGAGNSNRIIEYFYNDAKPVNGLSYYRLRQTDFDNKSETSQAITIFVNSEKGELVLAPNPAQDNVKINFSSDNNSEITIRISDLNGKIMYGAVVMPSGKSISHNLNTEDFPKGTYFVTIIQNGMIYHSKLAINH